jgi:hypothetical protein
MAYRHLPLVNCYSLVASSKTEGLPSILLKRSRHL